MERESHIPKVNPLFQEQELEKVADLEFKQFLTTLDARAIREEDGKFSLQGTLLNMSESLVFPPFGRPDYRLRRHMSWIDVLKGQALLTHQNRGERETKRSVVDRNNFLFALSYLYGRDQVLREHNGNGTVMADALDKAVKLWGEHAMGDFIKDIVNTPLHERVANQFKSGRTKSRGSNTNSTKFEPTNSITECAIDPEERKIILSSATLEFLQGQIPAIDKEISKSPSRASHNMPDWEALGMHKVIGEVVEYVRRANNHEETMIPLDVVNLLDLRDGLRISIAYLQKHGFADIGVLEEVIKRATTKIK